MFQFALPDPGEGLLEADIVEWHVAVGDEVRVNDTLVEIETAKSLVELPSPVSGTVLRLLAEPGGMLNAWIRKLNRDSGAPARPKGQVGI